MVTNRQGKILAAIVKEYSLTGHPVGSEELLSKFNFDCSAATIRNEMKALEEEDYITQPHTSAGRVPTDQGYRYFVNRLMRHLELTAAEQQRLQQELARFQKQYLELGRSISKFLSETSQGAAFALLPASRQGGPESVGTSGLSKIVEQNASQEEIREIAAFLDELEEQGQALIKKDIREVETFIGREAPLPVKSDFSLVVTRVKTPDGRSGLIGIVGPKRMKYERNISLLEYVSKLLSSGLGAILIFNFSALGGSAFGG